MRPEAAGAAAAAPDRAEARIQALLRISRDAVLIVRHADHRILAANRAAERLYQIDADVLCTLRYDELVTDALASEDLFSKHRDHVPLRFHRRADGSRFPVELRIAWFTEDGEEIGCFGVHDLTRLEQEEQRLKAAEATYGAIFQSAPYAVLLLDRHGSVADVNAAAQALYKRPRATLLGLPMAQLLRDPRAARLYFSRPRWQATDEWHVRADGSAFPADVVVSQVRGVGRFHAIVMVRDVTGERALTAQLQASEARWRFALEGHGDALWEWDIDRGTFFVSQELSEQLGRGPQPTEHAPTYWGSLVHPADRARLSKALVAHLKGETSLLDVETRLSMREGGERWVWMRGRVMARDDNGRALRLLGSVRDVHAQKLQAAELARWREQLQHTERLTGMGELAAALAHELNQPLTSIRNFAGAALRRLDKEALRDPQEVRKAVQLVADESLRAGRIVQQIRSFMRKGPRRFEPVALPELLQGVERLVALRAAHEDAQVDLDLPADLPALYVDRTLVEQLLLNLIGNGLDAMGAAGAEHRVVVSARRESARTVELCVRDQGCGLPDPADGDIFSPFFSTKTDGLGMGLAICRSIVEAHQGRIHAEAHPGGGTAFFVSLPCVEDCPDDPPRPPPRVRRR